MSIPLQSQGFRSGAAQSGSRSNSLESRSPFHRRFMPTENEMTYLRYSGVFDLETVFRSCCARREPIPSLSLSSCSWWPDFGPDYCRPGKAEGGLLWFPQL
jgi:hypothetical protein